MKNFYDTYVTAGDVMSTLRGRLDVLDAAQAHLEMSLLHAPDGSLRINRANSSSPEYYWRRSPADWNGSYILKKDLPFAVKLMQKGYDLRSLDTVKRESALIGKLVNDYPALPAEDILSDMPEQYRRYVIPFRESDAAFVKAWMSREFQTNTYFDAKAAFKTERGEYVRSKSELIIANLLSRADIPYRYECPLYLSSGRTVYPDFTILKMPERIEIYWEHLGMMDDPDYSDSASRKIERYILSGILPGRQLIVTLETSASPLNPECLEIIIDSLCR